MHKSFISIHLMLLFIASELCTLICAFNFNTSHVTVYLGVIFILFFTYIFQYISCYCLSSGGSDSDIMLDHFNTSHVTVYPVAPFSSDNVQIISIHLMLLFITETYRLTGWDRHISIHLMLLFIESGISKKTFLIQISIHLMLLFICFIRQCNKLFVHFNTSHVTVYQYLYTSTAFASIISIHLMLLFIHSRYKEQRIKI